MGSIGAKKKGGIMWEGVLTRTVAPQENMVVVVGGEGEEH